MKNWTDEEIKQREEEIKKWIGTTVAEGELWIPPSIDLSYLEKNHDDTLLV